MHPPTYVSDCWRIAFVPPSAMDMTAPMECIHCVNACIRQLADALRDVIVIALCPTNGGGGRRGDRQFTPTRRGNNLFRASETVPVSACPDATIKSPLSRGDLGVCLMQSRRNSLATFAYLPNPNATAAPPLGPATPPLQLTPRRCVRYPRRFRQPISTTAAQNTLYRTLQVNLMPHRGRR